MKNLILQNVEIWYKDGKGFLQTYEATYNQETKQVQLQIPITSMSSLGNWNIRSNMVLL